ncbi:hypothetical protein HHK36_017917 [Tetracentron sinense]|uniref:Cytochrome b5 heme-binding domain-containing protein n=1 Tax=Tetracentron sinense TaxID=13715 RepID=A0A835DD11_TETSI|nr:hypothetical protein HHK36_017917 [Tetracentron sinense]
MAFYSIFTEAIPAYTGLSPAAFFTILALMFGVYRLVCGMFVAPEDSKAEEKNFNPMESFQFADPVQLGDVTVEDLRAYDGSDPKKPLLMAIKGQIYDVSRSRFGTGYEHLKIVGTGLRQNNSYAVALVDLRCCNLRDDANAITYIKNCNQSKRKMQLFDKFCLMLPHNVVIESSACSVILKMFYGPGGPYALFAGRDASRALALMSFDPQDLTGNIEGLSSSELEVLQDWEFKFMEKYVKVGQLVSESAKTEDIGSGEKTERCEDQEPKKEI